MMIGNMKRQQAYIGRSNKELRKEEILKKRIETTKTKNKTLIKELPKKKLIPLLTKTSSNFHLQKRSWVIFLFFILLTYCTSLLRYRWSLRFDYKNDDQCLKESRPFIIYVYINDWTLKGRTTNFNVGLYNHGLKLLILKKTNNQYLPKVFFLIWPKGLRYFLCRSDW